MSERVVAVDLARLLAVLGMFSAHLVAPVEGLPGSLFTAATSGFPSTLFAVVAGAGSALAASRSPSLPAAIAAQAARGGLVVLVGALLGLVPTFIAIVLVPLGVSIALAAPLVRAPSAVLGGIAAALAVAGPLATSALAARGPGAGPQGPLAWALDDLLLGGVYPVATWLVYVLGGILVGRAVARAAREGDELLTGARLALGGLVAAVAAGIASSAWVRLVAVPARLGPDAGPAAVEALTGRLGESGYGLPHGTGWDALLIGAPHTGSTTDILITGGGAVLVIGALGLWVKAISGLHRERSSSAEVQWTSALRSAPEASGADGRPGRREHGPVTRVLAAAGGAGLTVYTVHVLSTWPLEAVDWPDPGLAWGLVLVLDLAFVVVLGAILARTGRRGPLEAVMRAVSRGAARAAGRRPPPIA